MKAERVLETCLYVDDLVAAEDFYTRVMGLEAFARVEGRHVFFRCGQSVFLVFNPESTCHPDENEVPEHGARGPGHVAFSMAEAEIGAWRDRLETEKVEIEQVHEWPGGGRSLYFRDPAGNSVELTTPKTWNLDPTP